MIFFSTNDARKIGATYSNKTKQKPKTILSHHAQIWLQTGHMLNIRAKATKLLEEHIGENLHDFGFGAEFLSTTPKEWSIKEKYWQDWLYYN